MSEQAGEFDHMESLTLTGGNHTLRAVPVKGDTWVGMIEVQSPTDAALLTPDHARLLRDWLDLMLSEHKPFTCPCPHGKGMHTEDGECFVCEDCGPAPEPPRKPESGWAYPTSTAKKPHFFPGIGERSLCGRYALIIVPPKFEFDPDTGKTGPNDCAACARKLEARR